MHHTQWQKVQLLVTKGSPNTTQVVVVEGDVHVGEKVREYVTCKVFFFNIFTYDL